MNQDKPNSDALTESLTVPEQDASEAETQLIIPELQPPNANAQPDILQAENEALKAKITLLEEEKEKIRNELVEAKYKTGELALAEFPLQWTDYTEDVFQDIIWRWHYKPEIDNSPRNVTPYCPQCENPRPLQVYRSHGNDGLPVFYLECRFDPQKYEIRLRRDPYNGPFLEIKVLIQQKLEDDTWKDAVNRRRKK